jgi:hypothetical protein
VELNHQLFQELLKLEQQAAQVAALLDDVPEDLRQQAIAAFAPMPAMRGFSARQRQVWGETWFGWIREAGDRWEARPPSVSTDEMQDLVLRFALGGK